MLKILNLVQKPQRRGAEVFAFQLAGQLRREGCCVRNVYLYPHAGDGALTLGEDDRCLGGREGHPAEVLLGVRPQLLRCVLRAIHEFDPDIVQANGARTLKYGALARRFARSESWAFIYRNIAEPERWLSGWRRRTFYERIVMPNVDGIVGVSDVTLASVRDRYRVDVPAVKIPRAVDGAGLNPSRTRPEVRAALGTPLDAPVAVFIGSLVTEKRPDRLLRVFESLRIRMPEAHLWLIGEGPLRASVATQVAKSDLERSVSFLGVQEHVANFLAAADVMLLTSDTEGTPGVVLEAGAVGVPVVATRVGGVEASVRHGETGLLVDRDDEAAFVDATAALLQDQQLRARMGASARAWVSEHFALDVVAKAYLELYLDVLARARVSP